MLPRHFYTNNDIFTLVKGLVRDYRITNKNNEYLKGYIVGKIHALLDYGLYIDKVSSEEYEHFNRFVRMFCK